MNQKYSYSVIMRLFAIAISSVGTLFLLPLILKTLGEYNFGIWGMVSSITGYLLLLDFGIALACTRYLSMQSENREKWTDIISNALLLSFIIAAILLLAAITTFSFAKSGVIPEQHQLLSIIIGITIVEVAVSIPLRMYMSILRTEVRYFDIGLFEVIRVCLRIGGIALGLYLGGGLIDIILIGSAANLIFFILPLINTIKRHKTLFFNKSAFKKATFSELLVFSKSTAISQTAEFLKFRTDSVLIAVVLGITASAHYTIIVFIVMMLTQILMRFMSYWDTIIISHIGKNDIDQANKKLLTALETGIAISAIALANTVIFGDTFLRTWVGDEYTFLHNPLIILTLILPGISCQMATTPYFNAVGRQRLNANIDMGEVFLKLLLIVPMSAIFGLTGFIYSSIISAIIFSIGIRLYFLNEETSSSKIFIYKKFLTLASKYTILTMLILISYKIALSIIPDRSHVQALMCATQMAAICIISYKILFLKKITKRKNAKDPSHSQT
ncbi:MAG: oligosaccharide flippase family protein [Thiolinea sp.]